MAEICSREEAEFMIYDMTKGSPLKMILSFSAPMLIGNIFQQIYNFVDAAVVGKFVGAKSLAAVGATSTLMTLAICFMMGMTNGAGIIISQCFGKRDFVKLRETVASLVYIIVVMAVLTSAAGYGHHSTAKAIIEYFEKNGHQCEMLDIFDYINHRLGNSIQDG